MRFLAISALLVVGCTEYNVMPDAGPLGVDAYFAQPDAYVPCNDTTIENDIHHCGLCDNVCSPSYFDRCLSGVCSCGFAGAVCASDQECRHGLCITSDVTGRNCEFDDVCPGGFVCIHGHCTREQCIPEVCDGIDNDCDGLIDGTPDSPLSRWCWDDTTPGSAIHLPPCLRGSQVCNSGMWDRCVGAVQPIPEVGTLACDALDNNCDGCIDGVLNPDSSCELLIVTGFDIIFAFDTSSSMNEEINSVREAVGRFSALFMGNPLFQFGIVLFPGVGITPGAVPVLHQDLTDFATFQTTLSGDLLGSGGSEPSIDTVFMLGNGELPVTWRTGTIRILILFTDEVPQSYRTPITTMALACDQLTHGESLVSFVNPVYWEFGICGRAFELSPDPELMFMDLQTIIADPCRAP